MIGGAPKTDAPAPNPDAALAAARGYVAEGMSTSAAARRAAADALRQAEVQAETERQAMLDRTEKDCDALRAAAMARMDDAVDYLLEKVVKR